MLGLAAAGGSDGSLSNLVGGDHAAKPILQTLNISQGVSQGLLLKKVQPVYPPNALRMRIEGAVKLSATVGKTGSITAVKVISGEPLLGQAAMEAVKQWKYKPYLLNGDPVEIQTEVTINFKLPN
jgi:protein TonB